MNFCMSNNEGIKAYFQDNSNEYIPVSELIYVHTHPLVGKSFLTEIDAEVSKILAIAHNVPNAYIAKLQDIVIRIGKALPTVDSSNAEGILRDLRELYMLATRINSMDFSK
jgi:hypothetical protein